MHSRPDKYAKTMRVPIEPEKSHETSVCAYCAVYVCRQNARWQSSGGLHSLSAVSILKYIFKTFNYEMKL